MKLSKKTLSMAACTLALTAMTATAFAAPADQTITLEVKDTNAPVVFAKLAQSEDAQMPLIKLTTGTQMKAIKLDQAIVLKNADGTVQYTAVVKASPATKNSADAEVVAAVACVPAQAITSNK